MFALKNLISNLNPGSEGTNNQDYKQATTWTSRKGAVVFRRIKCMHGFLAFMRRPLKGALFAIWIVDLLQIINKGWVLCSVCEGDVSALAARAVIITK